MLNNSLKQKEIPDPWKQANISAMFSKKKKKSSSKLQSSQSDSHYM